MIKIAPSILAADFAAMGSEVAMLHNAGADLVHVDVMDGRFVPNISLGQSMVAAIKKNTDLPLDVHLMIEEPERYIDEFAQAGADIITIHTEATRHLHRVLNMIRENGVKAGVALNPATSPEELLYVLELCDIVLVMTVNPGFGGQKFIKGMMPKISRVREMIKQSGFEIDLEVDGGIGVTTAKEAIYAGANILVAGSAVFGVSDRAAAIQSLKTNE